MSDAPITSHGRGGAGNIARDEKAYTDGEIIREGPLGDQGDGPYSTGRGGAGNIDSPSLKPTTDHHTTTTSSSAHSNRSVSPVAVGDADVIPETATKVGGYENYHIGRGGEGNVHREHGKEGGKERGKEHGGLVEKAKHMFHHDKEGGKEGH